MPLTGFKAQNHPQQVLVHGAKVDVDERATPQEFFDMLHRRFSFSIDAAALPYNCKLERFWSPEDDGLAQDWTGERIWCNPPFSDVRPWVQKAHESTTADLVVMLLPANRTEQTWWQEFVEPFRDRQLSRLRVEFLPGRLRFGIGRNAPISNTRPPFGCCLLIWRAAA